jgi:TrmH family RNA methyltransferase
VDGPGPGDALGPRAPALQHLRRLTGRRRARQEHGQFVIDGPTLVAEALASRVEVIEVYAEAGAPDDVLDAARGAGVPVRAVSEGALAKVTSPVTPQPAAALARIPAPATTDALRGLVLVLVGVADPGNAGTLLRVAEAAGASAVVSCADAVDVWNPKCVRASAGSAFRVPHLPAGPTDDAVVALRGAGMTLVACDVSGVDAHDDTDLTGDVAVLLGNEAHGLSPDLVAAADRVVRIPMAGDVESLNVAMTGAVMAFESSRQRRRSR